MKLSLLSLLSFFAIAITVTINGQQFLRRVSDTTVQEQGRWGRISPVVEFEQQLSFKQAAAADLVNAREFIPTDPVPTIPPIPTDPTLPPIPEGWNYVYDQCSDYGILYTNGQVIQNTTKIFYATAIYSGCIAVNIEVWTGTVWDAGTDPKPYRACYEDGGSRGLQWGDFAPRRVTVSEVEAGDSYGFTVCWDES
jgi:hypothetical protein